MDFGVIVDVETTGLDASVDRIIEIGMVEFAVEGDSDPELVRTYGALQDPGCVISDEIVRITGITNKVVAGQKIDWNVIRSYLARASIVIAHNMDFDRRFVEASGEWPTTPMHWGCSMRHIDWRKHHFNTLSLNYLAADHGFVNPFAHRAVFDCATTFRLISPYLQELIARSYLREYVVKAVGSPFETKDVLRQRGYRWDSDERCWSRMISEAELGDERTFLSTFVYKGRLGHLELEVSR